MTAEESRDARFGELTTQLDRIERQSQRHERQSREALAALVDQVKGIALCLVALAEHVDECDRTSWRPFGDGTRLTRPRH